MADDNFDASDDLDYYHDDPDQESTDKPDRKKNIVIGFCASVVLILSAIFYLPSSIGGKITINTGTNKEFGNGVSQTVACSGETSISVTPVARFVNASSGSETFYLDAFEVKNIPASCKGNDFRFEFYNADSSGSSLNIFSPSQNAAIIYMKKDGTFVGGYGSFGLTVKSQSIVDGKYQFEASLLEPTASLALISKLVLKTGARIPAKPYLVESSSFGNVTCAVLENGFGAQCWGLNSHGEIGDGTSTPSKPPTFISSITEQLKAFGNGEMHTCAVTFSGRALCWGWGNVGQLGNGKLTPNYPTPQSVTGLSTGVSRIGAGQQFTCALMDSGGVKCWGFANNGRLGSVQTTHKTVPIDVPDIVNANSIAVAQNSACVGLKSGGVKCWGNGYNNGNTRVSVSGLTETVSAVATKTNGGCALLSSGANTGSIKCWAAAVTPSASLQAGVSGATNLVGGNSHFCALLNSGSMKCWGANTAGQLGTGNTTSQITAVSVVGLAEKVISISAGNSHTCAILESRLVKCWGNNSSQQLGNSGGSSSTPVTALTLEEAP